MELTRVTPTSKNAVTPRDQKTPAFKCSLASGLVTAPLRLNRSLSRGCSCGSTSALVQTLPISEVSRLRTPSCLCATNPPVLHDRDWQLVYFSPQTHLLGKSDKGTLLFSFPQTQSDLSTSFLQGIPQVYKQENMAKKRPLGRST